jgi:hypothetical protein
MLATLAIAIPAGLHIALSVTLGYAIRYAQGLPAEARAFSVATFIFVAILAVIAMAMGLFFGILAVIAMAMGLFFGGSIPTMAYSVGLVSYMLRWVGKRRGRERLTASIIGGVLGLIVGSLETAVVFALMNLSFSLNAYATFFQWPEILTVDGIALLWFSLNPLANLAAGVQIGYRLGKQLEEMTTYWFW